MTLKDQVYDKNILIEGKMREIAALFTTVYDQEKVIRSEIDLLYEEIRILNEQIQG